MHLLFSGHFGVREDGQCGGQIPGKQFVDAIDGMVCDATEDQPEIELRVESIELGGIHKE